MNDKQQLISACRDLIYYDDYKISNFETEQGKEIYNIAKEQLKLELLINKLFKSLKIVYKTLSIEYKFNNEIYNEEFFKLEETIEKNFQKLKVLEYEKSFNALFCPLIDFVESN